MMPFEGYGLLTVDLHERFNFPIENGLNPYIFAFIFTDYTLCSLTILTLCACFSNSINDKKMLFSGLISSVLIVTLQQIFLRYSLAFTHYHLLFAACIIGSAGFFLRKGKKSVTSRIVVIVALAYYAFLFMVHFVIIYNSLYPSIDRVKSQEMETYQSMKLLIDKGMSKDAINLYGSKLSSKYFEWDKGKYPDFVQNNFSLKDVYEKMKTHNKWEYSFINSKINKETEEGKIYYLSKTGDTENLLYYKLDRGIARGILFEYFCLIYNVLLSFTFVWMIGFFKLSEMHKNIVR